MQDLLADAGKFVFGIISGPQRAMDHIIFDPIARKIPQGSQELADSLISITGDTIVGLTAPAGKARNMKKWLPAVRVPELFSGFIAMNRDYFRIAYFFVVAKHQQAIETNFGLTPGSLDNMAANGKRMSDAILAMMQKGGFSGRIVSDAIDYFENVYGNGKPRDSIARNATETYVLTRFLIDNKMPHEAEKVLPQETAHRMLQHLFSTVTDKTMIIKGLALISSGTLSIRGATTYPEAVKGALLILGGAELSTVLPGRRYPNPLQNNQSMSRRDALGKILGFLAAPTKNTIEHMLTQKEVKPAFQLLGTANLLDFIVNTSVAIRHDHSRATESCGKFGMYMLYAVAARLRGQMAGRAESWRNFIAGAEVSPDKLGI